MSQHTPGPWVTSYTEVYTEQGLLVAQCVDEPNRSREKAKGNARLIAAAPEMAEGLRLISDGINTGVDHEQVWSPKELRSHWLQLQGIAESLLARIDGSQPNE